jgi:hypothetical protein
MKVLDDDGTQLIQCRNCIAGRWETECCNGSGGCDCRGQVVDMGRCLVCNGTGWHRPDANTDANRRSIAGCSYIGRGPIYR